MTSQPSHPMQGARPVVCHMPERSIRSLTLQATSYLKLSDPFLSMGPDSDIRQLHISF